MMHSSLARMLSLSMITFCRCQSAVHWPVFACSLSARRNKFCNLAMGQHRMHEFFYKHKHAVQVLITSQRQGRNIKANCTQSLNGEYCRSKQALGSKGVQEFSMELQDQKSLPESRSTGKTGLSLPGGASSSSSSSTACISIWPRGSVPWTVACPAA